MTIDQPCMLLLFAVNICKIVRWKGDYLKRLHSNSTLLFIFWCCYIMAAKVISHNIELKMMQKTYFCPLWTTLDILCDCVYAYEFCYVLTSDMKHFQHRYMSLLLCHYKWFEFTVVLSTSCRIILTRYLWSSPEIIFVIWSAGFFHLCLI